MVSTPSKFSLTFSELLLHELDKLILKLELVLNLSRESEYEESRTGLCNFVFDPEKFISCDDLQKILEEEKFVINCETLIRTFQKLSKEVETSQSFTTLIEIVVNAATKLLKQGDALENMKTFKTLKMELQQKIKIHQETSLKKEMEIIDKFWQQREKFRENVTELSFEKNFNKLWVKSQKEQQELHLKKVSTKTYQELLSVTVDQSISIDVGTNVCRFYHQKNEDLKLEIQAMEMKYESHVETIETEFQKAVGQKRRLLTMKRQENERFMQRKVEIDNYLDMKRTKKADKEMRMLQEKNIVVIQAWWRGLMVRKHFGRFKMFKARSKQIRKELRLKRKQNKEIKNKKK